LIKNNTVVILNGSELLVGYLNSAVREHVDFILLNSIELHICKFLEESSLNLSALGVHEIDVEEVASSFSIIPSPHVSLLDYSGLDAPFGCV
jgi:hypothetical protein